MAVGGLSGLAFMCSGSPPGQGPLASTSTNASNFSSLRRDTGYHRRSRRPARQYVWPRLRDAFPFGGYGMSDRSDADKVGESSARPSNSLTVPKRRR